MVPSLRSDYIKITSYPLFHVKGKLRTGFVDCPPSFTYILITVSFKTRILKFLWIGMQTAAWLTFSIKFKVLTKTYEKYNVYLFHIHSWRIFSLDREFLVEVFLFFFFPDAIVSFFSGYFQDFILFIFGFLCITFYPAWVSLRFLNL